MPIAALELLMILVAVIVLAVVLTQAQGRGKARTEQNAETVKLVRTVRGVDGREETLLLVNERVILAANNDGLRLSDYADEVEQLEAVAARIAAALDVTVEFARVGGQRPDDEKGLAMRDMPRMTEETVDMVEARRRLSNTGQRQGG